MALCMVLRNLSFCSSSMHGIKQQQATSVSSMKAPYEGLRVLDLSDRHSGAFAARLFGDFGAEVILVESREGHSLRREPPFLDGKPGPDRSVMHAFNNWNKKSVVVDEPEEFADFVAGADVVITTSNPLRTLPSLSNDAIHICITAHGLASPLSGKPGNNLTISARTGWSFINRYRGEPPLQMPRNQTGYIGGVLGYICGAAALRRRKSGTSAEVVDVSELEAFMLTVHPWGVRSVYANAGESNGSSGIRPRGRAGPLWDAADGRMNFGIADFRNWSQAMEVLKLPEIGKISELVPDIGRHSKDLRFVTRAIAESLPSVSRWPTFHKLARLRCLTGVMQDIQDLVGNEQLLARDFIVETQVDGKTVRAPGAPGKLQPSPWKLHSQAPKIDEHHGQTAMKKGQVLYNKEEPSLSEKELSVGPLSGVRVLSFGQAWSGTFSTELLALLGADVVQLGSIKRPDVFRRLTGSVPDGVLDSDRLQHPLNTQGEYNSVNLNKREVTLDLGQEVGRELLWKLIPKFDILVDNFRPTVMPSWGFTMEKLQEIKSDVIWASVSGYGQSGPYWDYPANGATTEPMSGLSSLHGYEGDLGMNTAGLYPDPVSGYFLVASIMAALTHRDQTGEAQRIDLSMMEALAHVCGDAVIEFDVTGKIPRPGGNHHPRIAPHNCYDAADGQWLVIATETEAAWLSLIKHIGDSRLFADKFATMKSRKINEVSLDTILGEWCASQNADSAERELGRLGVSVARVRTLYELFEKPESNFVESGFFSFIDHPETGPTWLPGRPWRFSAAEGSPLRPSPCVGEHSKEVLMNELDLTEKDYQTLVAKGITGTVYES
ncbi:MAG: CoA transferase [Gammaproteobacteria bacterium TMED1]|nr:MAG: CoA transferase [Gammaproteobacteria bacterium TMED1]